MATLGVSMAPSFKDASRSFYYDVMESIFSMYVDDQGQPILDIPLKTQYEVSNVAKNLKALNEIFLAQYGTGGWERAEKDFKDKDIKEFPDESSLKAQFYLIEEELFTTLTHYSQLNFIPQVYKDAVLGYSLTLDKTDKLDDALKSQKKEILQKALNAKDIQSFKKTLSEKDENNESILSKSINNYDDKDHHAFLNKIPNFFKNLTDNFSAKSKNNPKVAQNALKDTPEGLEPAKSNIKKGFGS